MVLVSLGLLPSFMFPMQVAKCAYPDIGQFGGLKIRIRDGSLDACRATLHSA